MDVPEELDVDDDSTTETLVALEAWVDNDRWQGVPFYLRTGKAVGDTRRTVTLRFTTPPTRLFEDVEREPNDLVLELTDADPLEAYERLLLDVLRGDQTLFTRADEVDRLWQICEPVLASPPTSEPYERSRTNR